MLFTKSDAFYGKHWIQWSRNQLWNCTHFRHPTDEQLQHSYIFSNYYNLQSVHFELRLLYSLTHICLIPIFQTCFEPYKVMHGIRCLVE